MSNDIFKVKSEIIQLGAYALTKRPHIDSEMSKNELRKMLESADESLRQIGIRARNIHNEIIED